MTLASPAGAGQCWRTERKNVSEKSDGTGHVPGRGRTWLWLVRVSEGEEAGEGGRRERGRTENGVSVE